MTTDGTDAPPCDDHGDPRSVLGIDTMTTDGTDAELLQKTEWTKVLQKGQSKPSKQVKWMVPPPPNKEWKPHNKYEVIDV
jgi:hypothetical protein